ncbi:MAG TPA: hypothetical protein DC058_09610 [Planctomycetaceae bacterium]|nr:hypothetical protein [Planctomycetaceae bacterium]HBC61460.1 hypothetical protein [Planctomycetaceae bacterium]
MGVTAEPGDCAVNVHSREKNTARTDADTGNLVMDVRVVVGGKSGGRTCRISGFCSGAADGDHYTKHATLAPAKIACPPECGANMALCDLRGLKNSVFFELERYSLG